MQYADTSKIREQKNRIEQAVYKIHLAGDADKVICKICGEFEVLDINWKNNKQRKEQIKTFEKKHLEKCTK